ncbi:hypothetical protein ACCQ10_09290 [Xanthomonas sp. NCPPB 1325]|uniref:hypothetical protein n=1 Tax=Xanthomonas sp. NCPPB 1325 TaxID=487529 RepID=UPI0035568509
MNIELKEAVKRLERACIAGMDEEYRDDLRAVLDGLSARPDAGSGGDALRDRTPADYAIEHAGYLATAAKRLLDARGELDVLLMRRDEEDDVGDWDMHAAQDSVDETSTGLRSAIYEFEKRRDRALAARQPVGVEPVAHRVIYPDGSRPSKWDSGKGHWPKVKGVAGARFEYAFPPPPAPAAVPVGWDWLRGVIGGMPVRHEPMSGQMMSYVQRDEVLGWIEEGKRRAEQVAAVPVDGRDRLLAALERAAAAETALRRLVDECENDMTPGWEDRMTEEISRANTLLATHPQPAAAKEPASFRFIAEEDRAPTRHDMRDRGSVGYQHKPSPTDEGAKG